MISVTLILITNIRSELELLCDLPFTASQFSWRQAPCDRRQEIYFPTEHLRLYSLCNILSDEGMGLSFTIAAGPRQLSHSWVRIPRDSWPYFTISDSRLPQPGGSGPVFISPRDRVAQLYRQALRSLFIASYDSQGYGGDIRTNIHPQVLQISTNEW
jgi:hypothetical protein